ncbi:Ig-like and fibronectin type-III domain-containing protein 1 [Halyomorpha halys]|uniref:Ig-like and fibronectin type-III domain-containing protein 1 n=1 Tax=Halyomorpha halys TaxID=286706 RepID=UPI0006D508EF|nr:Ig-like and fibronectin type-III domain-containing protein 1 isoform X1 [Halyomorpha halys]
MKLYLLFVFFHFVTSEGPHLFPLGVRRPDTDPVGELPSARESPVPLHIYEDDDALITCVVRSIGQNTVVWKRKEGDRWKVLTAGQERVTIDQRFQVLHDQGGDVWVLAVKEVNRNDSGLYSCEVNSVPEVRSYHQLNVLSRDLVPPTQDSATDRAGNHNYTECCIALNVSQSCLGFCNIHSILEGTTGQDPEHCETDFQSIVRCMADGRNHVPCCMEEKVPDICQDVCRGEYTVITDNIKTHFSCAAYTEQTLACIVEGIELLPSQPLDVQVIPLTDSSFGVEWKSPYNIPHNLTEYTVNVTMLKSFDSTSVTDIASEEQNNSQAIVTPHSVQVNVKVTDNQSNYVVIKELVPFTMYEVTLVAKNKHGSSLPSNPVRSLTLIPGNMRSVFPKKVPVLPDIPHCCAENGIQEKGCVDKLCGLVENKGAQLEVANLMICAPWATTAFKCLANGMDHTPCCRARGLPRICQDLCSGNLTQFDFSYFRCIKYMPSYISCLMEGYGVLPGSPNGVRISNVDLDFAIVHWEPPKSLGDTVVNYNVYYRPLHDNQEYSVITDVNSPLILEHLQSNTMYEVYVAAANVHGIGDPSQRVMFSTLSKKYEAELEMNENDYNVTACCVNAGLSTSCMPLCSYDASMSQLKMLAGVCGAEFFKLIRCGAGGRNHTPCCTRRGVSPPCLPVCSGTLIQSLITTTHTCIPYIGNIVQCFEEGTGKLPGPISELHALEITDSDITLTWKPPTEGANVTDYLINYKKVDNTSIHETVLKLDNLLNTTSTTEKITGLETGKLYKIFVVARNEHGTSLPSSILHVNISKTVVGDKGLAAVTTPPHSLAVSSHSATYVTISWQPPEFSQPAEQLIYRVFYKASSDTNFHSSDTTVTSHTLENLHPNTQYIFYITAILPKKGQSLPSETLIAWTDPAYPAFVEPPTVHPINLVVEGSSMTILCIAMGTPMPTISLYISGRLVRQEITRHMVTVVHNVTRDMNHISCYADNGYGTPMEARRRIIISYQPHLTANGIKMATHGDTVTLECLVEAHPDPKMVFWKDFANRIPVIQDPKHEIVIIKNNEEEDKWTMHLVIKNIDDSDGGEYYCHAENGFGNATQAVSVRLRNVPAVNNVTQCCMEQNVTSACMDACSFYLDIDAVIDRPECIGEFDKLMKCASDGSDHRACCAQNNVERSCLDWCRGEPLVAEDNKLCLLQYTKRIMSCFREGRDRLPGPPQNVRVERIDDHSVLVRWDPPLKNPHTVEMYRVFWRPANSKSPAYKNDSKTTSLKISSLKSGVIYECVVKAGNIRGTSTLTEPLRFSTDEKYITSAASVGEEHSQFGMAAGLVFMIVFLVGVVAGAVWFVRTRSLLGHKSTGGVAFENPSYLREVNMDHIQSGDANTSSGMNHSGWKHEQLHVPSSTEVAPSIYEELKLGQDGVGFKRLKP